MTIRISSICQGGHRLTQLILVVAALGGVLSQASSARLQAEDWPSWMGPQRDGVYRETGIIDEIPESGLPIKWSVEIAGGFAGPAVADGRVFLFDYVNEEGEAVNDPGTRPDLEGTERLIAFDEETGEELWRHEYKCDYNISYAAGPRCTPTVDGEHVYILGSVGDLQCLRVADGEMVWARNFQDDFRAEVPTWGFTAHPLVHDSLLYTMVGGPGQGVVAFDKRTGEVVWKKLDVKAGYCPPSIVEAGGVQQLLVFHPRGLESLSLDGETTYWSVPLSPEYEMSVTQPMRSGDRLYLSAIGEQAVMLQLNSDQPGVKELWRGDGVRHAVYCSNSTPIFADDVVFGADCGIGKLIAASAEDGTRLWETFQATRPEEDRRLSHGTAFLTRLGNSDRYLLFAETGHLIVATLTADQYQEHGRFKVVEPTNTIFRREVVWSHPAYANRTAFVRNDKRLVAVDLTD